MLLLTDITVGDDSYRMLATPWREGGTLQTARSLSEPNRVL